jgi:hypothetical protein
MDAVSGAARRGCPEVPFPVLDIVLGRIDIGGHTVSAEEEAGERQGVRACATTVTCNSGWPGTRGCYFRIISETDIVPDSIEVEIDGHNGEIKHAAVQVGPRDIDFTASINEGNAFGPGDNTTKYIVKWVCLK